LADDLARFRAEVGIDKPVVVGHSLGGMIGVELAARHPTVPRALVLVDPGPIDPLPETREQVTEGLRPLLERPVEHVLATHGGPTDRAALARALPSS
jgi:pimeloyl-ACP methyl ester carboxylesterase